MGSRNKGESYFTLDKYECTWEDAFMDVDWKLLEDAKKGIHGDNFGDLRDMKFY